MRELEARDRPREKLARLGPASLGDNELLAVVLGSGVPEGDALAVANSVLAAARGLRGLLRFSVDDLRAVHGIGIAKASQVLAALELGRRTLAPDPGERVRVRMPRDVAAVLMPEFSARPTEQFGLVLLDTKHRVLRTSVLSTGSLDSSVVHPREVFREAASGGAAAIVLFHNHPSGDPTPSPDDIALTHRLAAAGELMEIEVLDHVILGESRYCSLKEMGQI